MELNAGTKGPVGIVAPTREQLPRINPADGPIPSTIHDPSNTRMGGKGSTRILRPLSGGAQQRFIGGSGKFLSEGSLISPFLAQRRGGAEKLLEKPDNKPLQSHPDFGVEVGPPDPFSAPLRLCAKNLKMDESPAAWHSLLPLLSSVQNGNRRKQSQQSFVLRDLRDFLFKFSAQPQPRRPDSSS
ncbi:MAG: hypothetical protein U1F77_00175 [Kiritimatiellia bacterium]